MKKLNVSMEEKESNSKNILNPFISVPLKWDELNN